MLAGLCPAEDSAHFAAPSAGAAAAVDLAGMAAAAPDESPDAADLDPMAAGLSDEEAGPGGDAMDEADGPQPTATRQQPSRRVRRGKRVLCACIFLHWFDTKTSGNVLAMVGSPKTVACKTC